MKNKTVRYFFAFAVGTTLLISSLMSVPATADNDYTVSGTTYTYVALGAGLAGFAVFLASTGSQVGTASTLGGAIAFGTSGPIGVGPAGIADHSGRASKATKQASKVANTITSSSN